MAASFHEGIMAAPFRIIRFWTDYIRRDGALVEVDKVEYCAPGRAQLATTIAIVSHLGRIREDIDPDNPAGQMARARWEVIGAAYAAWKAGKEMPLDGTPLAAWAGITPQQIDVLRSFGIRTVEDIAGASDSVLTKVQLPGMRDLAEGAKRFLASRDQNAVSEAMGKMQSENADLREQLEEMRQMLVEMSQSKATEHEADGAEAPRRKRQSRVEEEAAA